MKKIKTNAFYLLYLQSSSSSFFLFFFLLLDCTVGMVFVAWRAFIWNGILVLNFYVICISVCVYICAFFMYAFSGTGISYITVNCELKTITYIPKHPNDISVSFVFYSIFFCALFLLWIMQFTVFFHLLKQRKIKHERNLLIFSSLRYKNPEKKQKCL